MDKTKHQVYIPILQYESYISFYDSFESLDYNSIKMIIDGYRYLSDHFLLRYNYSKIDFRRGEFEYDYESSKRQEKNEYLKDLLKNTKVVNLLKQIYKDSKQNNISELKEFINLINEKNKQIEDLYNKLILFETSQKEIPNKIEVITTDYVSLTYSDYHELITLSSLLNTYMGELKDLSNSLKSLEDKTSFNNYEDFDNYLSDLSSHCN